MTFESSVEFRLVHLYERPCRMEHPKGKGGSSATSLLPLFSVQTLSPPHSNILYGLWIHKYFSWMSFKMSCNSSAAATFSSIGVNLQRIRQPHSKIPLPLWDVNIGGFLYEQGRKLSISWIDGLAWLCMTAAQFLSIFCAISCIVT